MTHLLFHIHLIRRRSSKTYFDSHASARGGGKLKQESLGAMSRCGTNTCRILSISTSISMDGVDGEMELSLRLAAASSLLTYSPTLSLSLSFSFLIDIYLIIVNINVQEGGRKEQIRKRKPPLCDAPVQQRRPRTLYFLRPPLLYSARYILLCFLREREAWALTSPPKKGR